MPQMGFYRTLRSPLAAAWLCFYFLGPGRGWFRSFADHVHQAFWCAAIESAVMVPIYATTHLGRRRRREPQAPPPSAPLVNFLWTEAVCPGVVRWVQLLVARPFLSPPPPAGAPALSLSECLGDFGSAVPFLCLVHVVFDMSGVLRHHRAKVETMADRRAHKWRAHHRRARIKRALYRKVYIFARLIHAGLTAQALLYGFLAHMFTAMALYLEQMAAGTMVTALVVAVRTLKIWQFCIVVVFAILFLAIIICFAIELYDEEEDHQEQARAHPGGLRRPWRWRPVENLAIPQEMERRAEMRFIFMAAECVYLLVDLRWPVGLGWWLSPETAALWPEHVVRRFCAATLTGIPAPAVAALVDRGVLRQTHYERLWRRAGLTTEFVLGGGEAAVGIPGAGMASGAVMVLGKLAGSLVCGLEVAFGVCLFLGGMHVIPFNLSELMYYGENR